MNWKVALFIVIVVPFLSVGCSGVEVTDGDRGLEHQNLQIAELILNAAGRVPDAVRAMAFDLKKNCTQLITNFEPPKDKSVLKEYTPKNSEDLRQRSEEEHKKQKKSKTWWYASGGIVVAVGSWLLRAYGLGSIPIIGPLVSKFSARLGNGAVTNESIALGMQTAADKARDYYDKQADAIRAKLGTSLPEVAAMIPTGEKLVELIKGEMSKRGVLPANTKLYDANDTGVA